MKNAWHFPTKSEMAEIEPFIKKEKNKDEAALKQLGKEWTKLAWENKLSYEVNWLGMPIIQTPEDIVVFQEMIYELRPDYIIESGIAHGGSLVFYSSIMEMLDHGEVIGVDIKIFPHNRQRIEQHPMFKRITLIEGDAIAQSTIDQVKKHIKPDSNVLVILDSNHTTEHVYHELKHYSNFVKPGGYIVACDTIMPDLEGLRYAADDVKTNNALEGVKKFLKENPNFEIDRSWEKYYVTHQPQGFLKRIA